LKVKIVTPARLHLGIIDTSGDLGRLYGSIGVAIDRPNVVLEARSSQTLKATGEDSERTLKIAETFLDRFPKAKCAQINVSQGIPEHVGLGSGTQLSLAVGTAIARLSGVDISVREIAVALGRGRISGIGVNVFEHGGFILDAGRRCTGEVKGVQSDLSLAVLHRKFPAEWRFVVAIPSIERGLSGRHEKKAFSDLPPASPELVGRICRLIIMKMLPSLIEKNIKDFGESMTTIQNLVGESFSQAQGGRFFRSPVEDCVRFMLESGAYGAGQSSWGPTVYGLVANDSHAEKLKEHVEQFLDQRDDGIVFVAKANNDGARFSQTKS
jgi:beta-ribofuranosylaminobenzene 5'-phosphate synthase